MLDVYLNGARDDPANVEEAEASLVLLIAGPLFNDAGVDESDALAVSGADEGGRPADPDLRRSVLRWPSGGRSSERNPVDLARIWHADRILADSRRKRSRGRAV
jgi:hypothetical protein